MSRIADSPLVTNHPNRRAQVANTVATNAIEHFGVMSAREMSGA
jgi:hypothetical protein